MSTPMVTAMPAIRSPSIRDLCNGSWEGCMQCPFGDRAVTEAQVKPCFDLGQVAAAANSSVGIAGRGGASRR